MIYTTNKLLRACINYKSIFCIRTKTILNYYRLEVKHKFCLPITFNNLLKACFSIKKCLITIKTRPYAYFLLKPRLLTDF